MFALGCLALYGETCDFAKRLKEIYYLLEEDDIKNEEHCFTAMYCNQIIWTIHQDMCTYFNYRLMPDDFAAGAMTKFKKSLLWDVIHKLQFTSPIDCGTFPGEWKPRVLPPQTPPQLYNPPPSGPAPMCDQGMGRCDQQVAP
jgi:hypothetical protein